MPEPLPHLAPIATPCVSVCTLDEAGRLCTGCGRTLDEIAGWSGFSAERRASVMRRLSASRNLMREAPMGAGRDAK